jgi:chemotaxis signal transduction protein
MPLILVQFVNKIFGFIVARVHPVGTSDPSAISSGHGQDGPMHIVSSIFSNSNLVYPFSSDVSES